MGTLTKSVKYSSKYLNKQKLEIIKEIDSDVRYLKNTMSEYIYLNIYGLLNDRKEFLQRYKNFRLFPMLSGWEVQTIFKEVCIKYETLYDRLIKNLRCKVQKGDIIVEKYKKKTKNNQVGDIKRVYIKKSVSKFQKLIKYALYVELDALENAIKGKQELEELWVELNKTPSRLRAFKNLIGTLKIGLFKRFKLIELKTGTYSKALKENSGKNNSSELVFDESNAKYKHWFKYKVPNDMGKHIWIPLQINDEYHARKDFVADSQYLIKIVGNRVDIITTYSEEEPEFHPQQKIEGMDLNSKNNFAVISDGKVFDYDRKYIKEVINTLKKFDKIGFKNLSETNKEKLSKLCRRNEWYFKKLINSILTYCEQQNITDLVIEDLQLFNATFICSVEFEIKYSRLIRLLRLSNIKNWILTQAERKHIRIHTTPSPYTSKMCFVCGCDEDANRPTQELFQCVDCGFTMNAAMHASLRIKERATEDVLRHKLHDIDDYGRMVAKDVEVEQVRKVLVKFHKDKVKNAIII